MEEEHEGCKDKYGRGRVSPVECVGHVSSLAGSGVVGAAVAGTGRLRMAAMIMVAMPRQMSMSPMLKTACRAGRRSALTPD